jgi:hypothetical protein
VQAGITPAATYNANVFQRVAAFDVDPSGGVKGFVRFIMKGEAALHWRQLALRNDENEVKKQFNEAIRKYIPDGVQAELNHFVGMQDYEANLLAFIDVSGNAATTTGRHVFLPELFFESHVSHPFVSQDKRTTPIDVHFPQMEQDQVTYQVPTEFAIENPPAPADISWPNHAVFRDSSKVNGSDITIVRTVAYNYSLLDSKEYGDLRDFYQKVATADQQQLVLTRSQSAKGN